ncbi:MAG: oligosaccharide flippase family protein [Ferruginibacter sp.]
MLTKNIFLKYKNNPAVRSLGIYTFTNFFGKGVAFLLLPYFTNVLTKSDIGLISLFSSAIIFLMPFISMGVLQSASTDYFKLNKKDFRDYFTTSLLLPTGVFILSLGVFFLFRNGFIAKYNFPVSFIWLIPVVTFLSFISQHVINLIRNEEKPNLFMRAVLGRLFIEIALAIIFISGLSMAWEGRIMGIVISFGVFAIYAFYYFIHKGYLFGEIKKQVIKDELVFSVPIITMQFSVFCMNYSDAFFLSRFTNDNNAEVGVYAIACIFASIIITLCSALLQYILPRIYKMLSEPVINYASIRKLFVGYFAIMTAGLLFLLLFVPLAYKFMVHKDYLPGLNYYWLICIGYYFWTIAYLFFSFLLYYKHKRKIIAMSATFACISLISNYFFVKNMGSNGAAISVFCSYLIVLMITLIFTRKQMSFIFKKNTVPNQTN